MRDMVGVLTRKKGFLFLMILSLLFWAVPETWAAPLSLEQNIKALLNKPIKVPGHFDFVVVGDNRNGVEVYPRLLEKAAALHPLFILHVGDLVNHGDPAGFEDYSRQIAALPVPIVHVPGNHDLRNGEAAYLKYVGAPNWFFDLGPVRFIGLDNGRGTFTPEALAMARKALTDQKICLPAFHYPPPVGRWRVHAMDEENNRNGTQEIFELIRKAKIPLVFLGHIHLYDEMDMDGTRYIISAGGGAPLHGKYNFGKAEYGFLLVRVRPSGITHQWIPLQ
jgi:3',5'-cyclic AMP phosphodiesterase CpdA